MRPRALLLAALLAALVLASVPAPSSADVFGAVTGPDAIAPRATGSYNVTITGGPPDVVEYSIEYFLRGADLTGGTPKEDNPGRASGSQATLRANITAPEKDQIVTLVVRISARSGDAVENTTAEKAIRVVTPIVLRATFQNAAPTAALNVTVRFFVDDLLVGTQTISRIEGNGQGTATFSYLPLSLAPGAHRVRAEADLDGDGRIDPARGEVVVSQIIFQEAPPLSQGVSLLVGIAAFFGAFLVVVAWRRRKQT